MAKFTKINNTGGGMGLITYKIECLPADFANNAEINFGGDIGAGEIIVDCYLDVVTAEATATTKTLDVGLLSSESGGDADGFLDAVSVAATGIVYPTLINATPTRGALLRVVSGEAGEHAGEAHASDSVTAKSVTATFNDAAGATELAVNIYIIARPTRVAS